jgi:hypothetical protein
MDTQYLNNTKRDSRKVKAMNIKINCDILLPIDVLTRLLILSNQV